MTDRLYLSCWMRGFTGANMARHFERMLGLFPFSKLAQRGPALRVYALEFVEPPAAERQFEAGTAAAAVVAAARDFTQPDCCIEADAFWDLWQYDTEWRLRPAGVTLACFGPAFEHENGDHLRIDFGLDAKFLPMAGIEGSLRMQQSNLRSLLHLVAEIERALPVERRQLWSESGANFAEVMAEALEKESGVRSQKSE